MNTFETYLKEDEETPELKKWIITEKAFSPWKNGAGLTDKWLYRKLVYHFNKDQHYMVYLSSTEHFISMQYWDDLHGNHKVDPLPLITKREKDAGRESENPFGNMFDEYRQDLEPDNHEHEHDIRIIDDEKKKIPYTREDIVKAIREHITKINEEYFRGRYTKYKLPMLIMPTQEQLDTVLASSKDDLVPS